MQTCGGCLCAVLTLEELPIRTPTVLGTKISVAEDTRGKFEVSVCTMDDRYYEIPEEERICEIQFREDAFYFR
jgi:hypothetical protein